MKTGYRRYLHLPDIMRAFLFDPGKLPLDVLDIVVIPVFVGCEYEISLVGDFPIRQPAISKTRFVRIDDNS